MAGRSTLEQAAGRKSDGGGGGRRGGSGSNAIKLAVVVIALIIAGVLLAWHFGAFDRPEPVVPLEQTLDEQGKKDLERSREINEKLQRIHKVPAGS